MANNDKERHLGTCPWSDPNATEGPDTCYCRWTSEESSSLYHRYDSSSSSSKESVNCCGCRCKCRMENLLNHVLRIVDVVMSILVNSNSK